MANLPPESFRLTKELLYASIMSDLDAQLDRERRRISLAGKGPWLREGVAAFFEKREPNFRATQTVNAAPSMKKKV